MRFTRPRLEGLIFLYFTLYLKKALICWSLLSFLGAILAILTTEVRGVEYDERSDLFSFRTVFRSIILETSLFARLTLLYVESCWDLALESLPFLDLRSERPYISTGVTGWHSCIVGMKPLS